MKRLRLIKFLNILLMGIVFGIFFVVCMELNNSNIRSSVMGLMLAAVYMFFYVLLVRVYEGFRLNVSSFWDIVLSQFLSFAIIDVIAFVIFCIALKQWISLGILLGLMAVQTLISCIWTKIANSVYLHHIPMLHAVVVYREQIPFGICENIQKRTKKINIQESLQIMKITEEVLRTLEVYDMVIINDLSADQRNRIVSHCALKDIEVIFYPEVSDVLISEAEDLILWHKSARYCHAFNLPFEYVLAKRFFDIILSAIALVVLSPLMLITAAAVHLNDRGTVIYRQKRLTKHGREFDILKFRSMEENAEADGEAVLAADNDHRITSIGKIIRFVRIDELPQLINILKGDMSIVGPRPERPELVTAYTAEIPEFALRLQRKAGLTGYAQVYGTYNSTPYEKLKMDLRYMAHPSILNDLKIILATIKVLFSGESTEGIKS